MRDMEGMSKGDVKLGRIDGNKFTSFHLEPIPQNRRHKLAFDTNKTKKVESTYCATWDLFAKTSDFDFQ